MIYDDGERVMPAVRRLEGEIAANHHEGYVHHFAPVPGRAGSRGVLVVKVWGHDRERVLAATRQRFAAELTR
jgi:hypothetical protein